MCEPFDVQYPTGLLSPRGKRFQREKTFTVPESRSVAQRRFPLLGGEAKHGFQLHRFG